MCIVDCTEEEDDEILVSGWGDVEGMREDLFKDWGEILERWVGKEKSRPTRVVKLCRKVEGKELLGHFVVLILFVCLFVCLSVCL